ncbi:ABC transporter transmembrane domain-containing protein [Rhizobium sp. SSA_523]|uniref:ABC transporter transmembrane domain-containing protein n=1 Tax=Rhizobium sp. SSA_523 TaxID=2952477 RepID=UPI00209081ED|nr:ABC transporter transmembrane domain-containing protein [Rhizobium sp. SSA_523]MCO5732472.1 ABC transporter transmembrane domain-containing protein [Rhizobium sp. SSA_523]WKC22386.1 ABC transporter transmembrane domain-containing protein [Rhizobium sp. SSA_523]
MEKSLTRYIWSNTYKQQLWILMIVAASMVPYFLSFDLPKRIVNGPIQGEGFSSPDDTQRFFHLSFDLPGLGHVELFEGFELDRVQMLMALSGVFLGLVVLNGLFKFYINTYKGQLGERMLRRIRFELVDLVLRFPPSHFKRVRGAEIATMVKDEVEPLGGFTGDAFVQPALLGGQALTALAFIVTQNFWLGMIALGIVMVQALIIPRMRKRLLVLGRQRQLTARELSGRVSEIVDGIHTIRGHDTSNLERADIADRLGRIFFIRYDLYQWKFLVKFINNFLAQVTPFLFYAIGGYLALQGRIDIGQLVAVIAAYKDLPGPLKELIDWDQARQDVQVKYAQVVEQFDVDGVSDPKVQAVVTDHVARLSAPLVVTGLLITDDSNAPVLSHVSLQIEPNETVAILGENGAGGDALAEALGRIVWPAAGRITLDGHDIREVPESVTGRRISYVSADAYFFHGSLRDNLLYVLKHAPLLEADTEGLDMRSLRRNIMEAMSSGNPVLDLNSDWIDYRSAGASGPDDLLKVIRPVLDAVTISHDLFELALRSRVDMETHPELPQRIVEVRSALRRRLDAHDLEGVIETFADGSYNSLATVSENILFGVLKPDLLDTQSLARHPYFRAVLRDSGLAERLFRMGLEIAENAVELFRDLPPDHPFFQQLTFMAAEDIPTFEAMLPRLKGQPWDKASPEERSSIIRLSFAYIEPRHRFGLLTPELTALIVQARRDFYSDIPADLAEAIERYDPSSFMPSASLMDNVLFGRISMQNADTTDQIRHLIREIFQELELEDHVLSIGLDFQVGAQGRRLTTVQRQKLNLARALLKRSDYFIFNRPLPALDQRAQETIITNIMRDLHEDGEKPAIIWVLPNARMSELFDRIMVFQNGNLVENGTYAELEGQKSMFKQLVS